jgi:hypothetical protein
MSELAFNQNGDNFEIPAGVTGWRVRRMKPRGAPELAYGKDGRPLVIPIESDMDDLRDAVGQLGRYRLDPVNEDGKIVESVPAAYIQVVNGERNAAPGPNPQPESESAVREAMRLNTELARSVIDQFPNMMTAAAELLRAADGAGIPARVPRIVELDESDADDDGDEDAEDGPPAPAGFDLNALLPQLLPLLMALFGKGGIDLSAMLDWRKAAPKAPRPQTTARTASATTGTPDSQHDAGASVDSASAGATLPPLDPQTMAHFIAIQSALAPDEAALAREVAGELAPAELRAWFDELSKLSVPDAVVKIRSLIGKPAAKKGDAS